MNNLPPEQTPEEPKKNGLLQEVEFGLGGVLLGIGTFLLMLFVLNYFNLVSLSLVFPNQLGWLPHRQYSQQKPPSPVFNFTQKEAPTGASPSPTPVKITLSCPVPQEFCNQAKSIKEGDFNALGFTLPKGTVLRAAFSGTISDQPKPTGRSETQPLLYIRDEQGNELIYSFYGTLLISISSGTVSKGTDIGSIGEGTFPPYPPLSGLNFLFTVKSGGKFVEIDPAKLEK